MSAKSKAPFLLGGCGCASILLGLALLGGAWFAGGKTLGGPDVAHYVNSPEGRTGVLAEAYVGFEFDYPTTWIVKPKDDTNFVSVERQVDGKTWENLNVGYFQTAGSREGDEALYPQLIAALQNQFAQQFTGLRKVSEGPTKVNDYDAYEGLFASQLQVDGKPVDVYTRAIILPTPDHKKGVTLLLMGLSFCPDLHEPDDVGKKGELPVALHSFRFTQ